MQRNVHVLNAIKKANGALNAIKLMKKYFTNVEPFVYFSVSVPGDFESEKTLTLLYNTVGVG